MTQSDPRPASPAAAGALPTPLSDLMARLGRELARAVLAIPDCDGILVNSAISFHSIAMPRDQVAALLETAP